jgi:hypothetical protein
MADCRVAALRERSDVQGNWQKCAACDKTMHKALPMMEVYPLTNEKVGRFHGDCYRLWNEERRVLAS